MPKSQKGIPTPHPLLSYSEGVLPSEPLPMLGTDIIVFPESLPMLKAHTPAAANETLKVAALTNAAPVPDDTAGQGLWITGSEDGESLFGTELADGMYGLGGDDHIRGYGGNDVIDGGDGNDALYGGAGDDDIYGGAGHDWLDGGMGADLLAGGVGDDVYYIDSAGDSLEELAIEGIDTVLIKNFDAVTYMLAPNIERFEYTGGVSDFRATGNQLDNFMISFSNVGVRLSGEDGDDVLYGSGASDVLTGGTGDDEIHASLVDDPRPGGSTDAEPWGSGDWLSGGEGGDQLFGGAGNDLIEGGRGRDQIHGGGGNDVFRFHRVDYEDGVIDSISGFDEGDQIRLGGLRGSGSIDADVSVFDIGADALIRIESTDFTYWIEVHNTTVELVESQIDLWII